MGFITISDHHLGDYVFLFSKHRRFANPRFVHINTQKNDLPTYCWWFRNPAPVEVGRLSHYWLPGFKNIQTVVISRICRISSPTFWHQKNMTFDTWLEDLHLVLETCDAWTLVSYSTGRYWCFGYFGGTSDCKPARFVTLFFWGGREGNNGALLGGSSELV